MLSHSEYLSPIGPLYIFEEDGLLVGVSKHMDLKSTINNDTSIASVMKEYFDRYFRGEDINMDIPYKVEGSLFFKTTIDECHKVPYGKVISYKDLGDRVAKRLNKKVSYRAIGQVMKRNPLLIYVPCHRIIKSDKTLGGYALGLDIKKFLLNLERVSYD